MNQKKRNQSPPVAEINLRRKFHDENASMVYAIQYIEEHPTNFGDVNQAILDAFHCFYAPLGVRAYGNSDEALQAAMRSISILEGHIRYLKATWGLTTTTVNNTSYLSENQNASTLSENQNVSTDEDQPGNSLSPEELEAVRIYQSFNQL